MSAIAILKNNCFRRSGLIASAVLAAVIGVSGTPAGNAEHSVHLKQVAPKQPQHHWYEIGRASWYGKLFQGHETASGEDYNMNAMTCAHRSLPLGSLVKVTNLRNHKSVIVRVNDRGPVPRNRIIDLSYAAARFLGFSNRGTAPVRVELISRTSELSQMAYPAFAAH
ncbi:MAG TPA: septal ring lytic transglycosylase RlpA family protein [Acidobacteriaceae bacterium]|nr:septal ring lytic transglycosylase RlpA family protein [Acidobacteriaceae bacterium]